MSKSKPESAKNVPEHLGLILDGNRRWAKSRDKSTLDGHKAGYENLKTICEAAWNRGVKYVSAYVFSTENWNRSKEEVGYLMNLLLWAADNDLKELEKKGAKILCVGSMDGVDKKVQKSIEGAVERTKNNQNGTLVLCFNYGGHREITDATKSIVESGVSSEDITEDLIAEHIYTPELPPLDMIIRTSGEQRLSNFMLWRAAYSELYFSEKLWPDFAEEDLDEALDDYASRQRRYGT